MTPVPSRRPTCRATEASSTRGDGSSGLGPSGRFSPVQSDSKPQPAASVASSTASSTCGPSGRVSSKSWKKPNRMRAGAVMPLPPGSEPVFAACHGMATRSSRTTAPNETAPITPR